MLDILPFIEDWIAQDRKFAIATVIETWGSAPRSVGAVMAVRDDNQIAGSVSGGCVENAVIEESLNVISTGVPKKLHFGISDDTAWSVGLTCGGELKVFVEPHLTLSQDPQDQEVWEALLDAFKGNDPVVLMTQFVEEKRPHLLVYPDGRAVGNWGPATSLAIEHAVQAYEHRTNRYASLGDQQAFMQVFPRRDRLLIIGASHVAVPLVKLAAELRFEIFVIDPRKLFASEERFPVQPEKILSEWPDEALESLNLHEDTYAVVLSHDPKIDDVALSRLLKSPAAYIGALGSKKSHQKRRERLKSMGFQDTDIDRIHGPVGLDIGAKTPEEIALSIMGQIVQQRSGFRDEMD